MKLKMGIVGAENSHTAAIGKLVNIDKRIRGFEVSHVWGETDELARAAAAEGGIAKIVKRPGEMLGEIDCVMIDHRDGKHHLAAARPFIEAGIPVFVDKPLATSTVAARKLLSLRRKHGVALTSMSAIPHQSSIAGIKRELCELKSLNAGWLLGPGSHEGPYGGVMFYGIHLTELMVALFGTSVVSVQASANGSICTSICEYENGLTVTIVLGSGSGWSVAAGVGGGVKQWTVEVDESTYLGSSRKVFKMFRSGKEPLSDEEMFVPVAVLEAMKRSLERKKRVKVALLDA